MTVSDELRFAPDYRRFAVSQQMTWPRLSGVLVLNSRNGFWKV